MDMAIRRRTAEDDLADELAALKALITPHPAVYTGHQEREVIAPKHRAVNFIHVPADKVEARHGNR